MKVLLLGDTHGDLEAIALSVMVAKKQGCDVVVQLGDFGFVWGRPKGIPRGTMSDEITDEQWAAGVQEQLAPVQRIVKKHGDGVQLWFLLGNHENYDAYERAGLPIAGDAPISLGDRLTYLPRGARWEWDGVRFLACGGAVSIDKAHRTEGLSWWPQELVRDEDVERCVAGGDCDVLLSHDSPNNPQLQRALDMYSEYNHMPYKVDAISRANREKMDQIADGTNPKRVYHGHYHHRYTWPTDRRVVVGLGMNGHGPDSWITFDCAQHQLSQKEGNDG